MSDKLPFILSDESVNSYGFKVLTGGIDTTRFESNPVMLYEHTYRDLIGTWTDLKVKNKELTAVPEFDEDDELAMKLHKKVKKGILKGVSIGLRILEWGEETTKEGGIILVAIRSELREASLTAVPSNANSLRLYDANGIELSEEQIQVTLSDRLKEGDPEPPRDFNNSNTDMKLTPENLVSLGLSADATEAQVNEAVRKLAADNQTLSDQHKQERQQQITALVDKAIEDKKLKADQRDHFVKLATADFDSAKTVIENLSAPADPKEHITKGDGGEPTTDPDRKDWSFSDWRKKDYEGLMKLKADDPDTYKALLDKDSVSRHIS